MLPPVFFMIYVTNNLYSYFSNVYPYQIDITHGISQENIPKIYVLRHGKHQQLTIEEIEPVQANADADADACTAFQHRSTK